MKEKKNKKTLKSISFSVLAGVLALTGGGLLAGCDTTNSASWITGTGAPTAETKANVGELYFDKETCNLYQKTNNGWELITNLKGEKGEPGEAGSQGTTGSQGETGEKGESGATWHVDTTYPQNAKSGDLFLNKTNWNVYTYNGETWELVGNIKGEKGEDGEDGQTPTIKISDDGYWIINGTKTNVKAQGEHGQDGKPGQDGVGIKDVDITYNYNEKGQLVQIIVITYTDDHKSDITVVIPDVPNPDDSGKVDNANYFVSEPSTVIKIDENGELQTDSYTNYLRNENDINKYVKMEPANIDFSQYNSETKDSFVATYTYSGKTYDFFVYPKTESELSTLTKLGEFYHGEFEYAYEIGYTGELFGNGYINTLYQDFTSVTPITESYFENLSRDTEGQYEANICDTPVRVTFYDPAKLRLADISPLCDANGLLISNISVKSNIEDLYIETNYIYEDYSIHFDTSKLSRITKLDASLLQNESDIEKFSTVGKNYNIELKDGSRVIFNVYDPDVCNINFVSVLFNGNSYINATVGDDIESVISTLILGSASVFYYEPVNGNSYEEVAITKDMIDISKLDLTTSGTQYVTINFGDGTYQHQVRVEVADSGDSTGGDETTGTTYTISEKFEQTLGTGSMILYDGGIGKMENDNGYGYAFSYILDEKNGIITIGEGSLAQYLKINGDTIEPYIPAEMPLNTYTYTEIEDGVQKTVGKFVCYENNIVVSYKIESDSEIYLATTNYILDGDLLSVQGQTFLIGEGNVLTEQEVSEIGTYSVSSEIESNFGSSDKITSVILYSNGTLDLVADDHKTNVPYTLENDILCNYGTYYYKLNEESKTIEKYVPSGDVLKTYISKSLEMKLECYGNNLLVIYRVQDNKEIYYYTSTYKENDTIFYAMGQIFTIGKDIVLDDGSTDGDETTGTEYSVPSDFSMNISSKNPVKSLVFGEDNVLTMIYSDGTSNNNGTYTRKDDYVLINGVMCVTLNETEKTISNYMPTVSILKTYVNAENNVNFECYDNNTATVYYSGTYYCTVEYTDDGTQFTAMNQTFTIGEDNSLTLLEE